MKAETYAELLRRGMRAKDMSRRQLEQELAQHAKKGGGHAYSYEHIRKIASGLPMMSQKFNEDVCFVLGLNAAEMWAVAEREKMKQRYGATAPSALPADPRLRTAWAQLTPADHERVIKFAEGIAAERSAERSHDNDDPAVIQARIQKDMALLTNALRNQPSAKATGTRR
jgi:hypothetical protein